MPLLAPSVPPGFPPKFVVAPEVFEQMQLYMDYTNPEERRIREFKMKMTLRDLSSNPGAQSSYLRHEDHPRVSCVQNKNLGMVFDFRMAETDEVISSVEGGMTHKALIPREPIQSALLPTELEEEEKKVALTMQRIVYLKLELAKLFQEEEEFWKLKSKKNWLQSGDKNTKAFHGWAKTRKMKNNIPKLFPPNEVRRIKQMVPGEVNDCYVWAHSRHKAYTVKTGYEMLAKAKTRTPSCMLKLKNPWSDYLEICWSPPENGVIKCNIHANWRNAHLHSGIAWIARDQSGNVSHHARDVLIHAPNRMVVELRCVIWTLMSLSDIGITKVIIASDYNEVMEAIKSPLQWPRYRDLLHQVMKLKEKFTMVVFEGEKISANGIARDIAKSVLRDGKFQSYLALGGPSWLHERLARERNRSDL
ncbi:hypothetical protein F2Q69_00001970 [Brassica cretica]|uniref:RNase H type-1 domain-containing protein n=1 Tax=Brassica cretica TaxID=69181 RepID=A0A8S9PDP3_BRACR|nr:hypothetical protein F2Q69_00001970 [Brassica cretica]